MDWYFATTSSAAVHRVLDTDAHGAVTGDRALECDGAVSCCRSLTLLPSARWRSHFLTVSRSPRLRLRYGMVDHPGPRKVHLSPIPLLGGIAIYLGFVLAILLTLHGAPQQQIVGILAGATLLAIVGLARRWRHAPPPGEAFRRHAGGALFLLASRESAPNSSSMFIPGTLGLVLDSCFTVFWVVGITAAFSILDHMDGLCAGIAAVAAGFSSRSAASLNRPTDGPHTRPPPRSARRSVFCAGISIPPRSSWAMAALCFSDS